MAAVRLFRFSQYFRNIAQINHFRCSHGLSATYAQTLLNLPETRITELSNGLKVATEHTDSPCTTVGFWIDAGSRFETPQTNGIGHFFEHLAYTGTSKRPVENLEREIQSLGAKFGSYVSREKTAFYAKCLSTDVPQVVDILSDVIKNTTLDEAKIETARKDILREMDEEVTTDFKQVTFDYLHLTGYQGTPLAKSIYGPTENIKSFNKEDIAAHTRDMFLPPRMVLTASGNVNHDELAKLAEKQFSTSDHTYTREIPSLHYCRFTGSEVRERDDWIPFAHIAVAVDTCGLDNPDIYALMLAKTAVGRWDKSFVSGADTVNELIHDIHKGEGCQSFDSFLMLYRDTGLWGCYFVMDTLTIIDFMLYLQNKWMNLCVSFSETDLIIAKNILRRELLHHLGNPLHSCVHISNQALVLGKCTSFSEVEKHIDGITLQNFRDVCQKYIYNRCPAVAAVGPTEGLLEYNRTRGGMSWVRY